jgi:hypothetical protein
LPCRCSSARAWAKVLHKRAIVADSTSKDRFIAVFRAEQFTNVRSLCRKSAFGVPYGATACERRFDAAQTSVFALGAEQDHIAPWRSVYKIELYSSADTKFILTGGGHTSSVVSPPGKAGAYYRVSTCSPLDHYVDPDTRLASASQKPGSWWPEWVRWLDAHSSSARVTPSFPSNSGGGVTSRGPAPGTYVFQT